MGELFKKWEVKPGATDWVFTIRKGITLTSGKTLDADDVIYSLNLHRSDTKSPAKPQLVDVSDIKKLNANQVQIPLRNANIYLHYMSDFLIVVVPNGTTTNFQLQQARRHGRLSLKTAVEGHKIAQVVAPY